MDDQEDEEHQVEQELINAMRVLDLSKLEHADVWLGATELESK
jgi:hypothetical protein